ncbi:MAG: 30S ribosomal protein S2 [Nitrososphaerota archaeon]|nr:30S ribosomal protein S2 [Nitrososphaerota archaeon]
MAEDQVKESQPVENQPEAEEKTLTENTVEETITDVPVVDEAGSEVPVEDNVVDEAGSEVPVEDNVVDEAGSEVPVEDNVVEEEPFVEEEPVKEEKQDVPPAEELLFPRDTLLSAGIHIGTRMKTLDMASFIYRVRPDGLFVLDVKKTDDRIRTAAKFLARYEKAKVAVSATRLYAHEPVKKFCEVTGSTPIIGRFIPGQLSNPQYSRRVDPEIIVVSDPRADAQAVKEASRVGIPIVALCSTDNEFAGVDLVIPTNNKGRRALAVIFWLLARQILRERGEIGFDSDPKETIDDFEAKVTRDEEDDF